MSTSTQGPWNWKFYGDVRREPHHKAVEIAANLTDAEIAEVLLTAARKVSDGWAQKVLEDEDGNVCALGSIHHACVEWLGQHISSDVDTDSVMIVDPMVQRILASLMIPQIETLTAWNDAEDRTQGDVVEFLKGDYATSSIINDLRTHASNCNEAECPTRLAVYYLDQLEKHGDISNEADGFDPTVGVH